MKTIPFFLSLCLICLFTNCTPFDLTIKPREECPPPKTDLPAATMSGSDRFGCVINDTLNWVAQVEFDNVLSGTSKIDLDWNSTNKYLRILTYRLHETPCEKIDQVFDIQFSNLEVGVNPKFESGSVYYVSRVSENRTSYLLDTLYENIFTLTHLDTENITVSGSFECRLINNKDSTDILHITDGRFDGNYAF